MPSLFISYSSLDHDSVERNIIATLRENGIDIWYSGESIETADDWEKKIKEGLRSCEWFLVVMTPRSADSKWVRREVFWAIDNREGRIIPVMLETCDPEELNLALLPIQYIDFRQNIEQAQQKLLAHLGWGKATQIGRLYHTSQTALASQEWATAIKQLTALLKLDPTHPEAQNQLSYARQQQELARLYDEGLTHFTAGRWQESLARFHNVRAVEPIYKDVVSLIAHATAQSKKTEEQQEGEKLASTARSTAPEPSRHPNPRWWLTRTSLALVLVLTVVYLSWWPVAAPDTASSTAGKWISNGEEGSISGVVDFIGTAPAARRVDTTADPICSRQYPNLTTEDAVIKDGKVANTFVYIKEGVLANGRRFDDYNFDPSSPAVTIDQRGCQFRPHVLGIQTNQKLRITNSDPTTHNFHPVPKLNVEWNQTQPKGSAAMEWSFRRPETLIPIKCNIHPWMRAYVAVLKHPYFAVSGEDGAYTIKNVPAGTYTVVAWREGGANGTEAMKTVTVTARENVKADFSFGFTPNVSAPGSVEVMPALQVSTVGVKQ